MCRVRMVGRCRRSAVPGAAVIGVAGGGGVPRRFIGSYGQCTARIVLGAGGSASLIAIGQAPELPQQPDGNSCPGSRRGAGGALTAGDRPCVALTA